MAIQEAVRIADERGTDLVEISPNAAPPVCKLMDYGKFRYEQIKKDKVSKKKQHVIVVKEIQVRPNIDPHDLEIKLKHAVEFLKKEFKVKFVLRFRGRELEYKETRGKDLYDKLMNYVSADGDLENAPFKDERNIIFTVAPKKK